MNHRNVTVLGVDLADPSGDASVRCTFDGDGTLLQYEMNRMADGESVRLQTKG